MDLYRIIRELEEQRLRLDRAIAVLDELYLPEGKTSAQEKRPGRRYMGAEERKRVSARMREYWAQRRKRT